MNLSNFYIATEINLFIMKNSIDEFIRKYGLDDFENTLELKAQEKIEFFNEFTELFKIIGRILDKAANIPSIRGLLLLMALAKLESSEEVINKSDVKNELNIDRLEKLAHAFEYLERNNYIKIIEKTPRFHIVKLNTEDNPDLILFKEIINKYWKSPREKKNKLKKWIEKNE